MNMGCGYIQSGSFFRTGVVYVKHTSELQIHMFTVTEPAGQTVRVLTDEQYIQQLLFYLVWTLTRPRCLHLSNTVDQ